MKPARLLALFLFTAVSFSGWAETGLLDRASNLEHDGEFKQAARLIEEALASDQLTAEQRREFTFERDRLERIRQDFPLTQEALFKALEGSLEGLSRGEFQQWIAEGRFDVRVIDGETRFMRSSVSNLYFRHPELEARRKKPKDKKAYAEKLLSSCRTIARAAHEEGRPYVSPKQFRMTMSVTTEADAAPSGALIQAWLPIPRQYPFQGRFKLLDASSMPQQIESELSPIRSVYLEQNARKGRPTKFEIEYIYETHGVRFEVDPDTVKEANANDPTLAPYLHEAPHVVFTPEMKSLSARVIGDEQNPYRKARNIYDWIAHHIKYSYAIEYSTIRNISDYCRTRGYGDCGQEALLFITLCRMNGVPARWQSGWFTFPGAKTIHDWTEIYIAPYGWMPVDPYMGIWATQYAATLSESERAEVRDFYFGGLDQYRMAANADHSRPLTPPKKSFRSDDVDFQRGELEYDGQNIYFDQYSFALEVKEVRAQ